MESNELQMDVVQVVQSSTCETVSGRSTITYEFGVNPERQAMFRITSNTGGGMFGRDWVVVSALIEILRAPTNAEEIRAVAFRPLFEGKSINTQSFLLAALLSEKVVVAHATKPRGYQVVDVDDFEDRLNELCGQEPAKKSGRAKKATRGAEKVETN